MEILIWGGIFILVMIVLNWESIVQAIVEFIQGLITLAGIVVGVGFLGYIVIAIFQELGAKNVFLSILIIAGTLLAGFLLYKSFIMIQEYYNSLQEQNKQKTQNLLRVYTSLTSEYSGNSSVQELLKKESNGIDQVSLYLIKKLGADLNSKDITGNTPLHKLVRKNLFGDTILFIRNGARLDVKNDQRKLPIDLAKKDMFVLLNLISTVRQQQYEWAKLLIERGSNVNAYDDFNNTPLHFIVQNKQEYTLEIIRLLLEQGAKINSINKSGQTPLHLSVLGIPEKTLQVLLDNGANIEQEDKNNRTIAHYVCMKNNIDALKILIDNNINLDKKDIHGNEPLFYAKLNKNNEMVSLIKAHSKKHKKRFWIILTSLVLIISILLFAFIRLPNPLKNKMYQYSIDYGYFSIADSLSKTPITNENYKRNKLKDMITSNSYDDKIFKYLLKRVDLNQQDSDGKTLLHYVYQYAPYNILAIVQKYNPKENTKDYFGKEACTYSVYNIDQNISICSQACDENNTVFCNNKGKEFYEKNKYLKAKQLFTITCGNDSSEGCFNLGELFNNGYGVEKDINKAIELYKKSCKQGYGPACEKISSLADQFYVDDPDYKNAFLLYKISCDNNLLKSCAMIGVMYQYGNGVKKDISKAQFFLKKSKLNGENFYNLAKNFNDRISENLYLISCSMDYSLACSKLAKDYNSKGKSFKALKFNKNSCQLGDTLICAQLGIIYKYGEGTKKNQKKSVYYFKKAKASDLLTLASISTDTGKSEFLYIKACKKNDKSACEKVVSMAYQNVNNFNFKKALKFYTIGCDKDIYWGCNNLGVMYSNGQGVKRNQVKAIKLFQKACNGNAQMGCKNLASYYQNGQGVRRDITKAIDLYTKACNGGIFQACYDLGNIYSTRYNSSMSQELYKKACDGGYLKACSQVTPSFNFKPSNNLFLNGLR